jgi:hypothetical protein
VGAKTKAGGEPPVEAGSAGELADVAAEVAEAVAPAAGESGRPAAVGDTAEDELVDVAADKLHEIATEPGALDATMAQLTEEELGLLFELAFGLVADYRGKHWELNERASRRLGKWLKLTFDRYPALWLRVQQYLPLAVLAGLVSYEVWARVRIDRELAAKKAKGQADAAAAD